MTGRNGWTRGESSCGGSQGPAGQVTWGWGRHHRHSRRRIDRHVESEPELDAGSSAVPGKADEPMPPTQDSYGEKLRPFDFRELHGWLGDLDSNQD